MWNVRATSHAFLTKKLAELRVYAFDFLVGLAIKFIFFLAAIYAAPLTNPDDTALRIFGFVIWYITAHLFAKLANFFLEEAYLGTLSQVLTTRTRLEALLGSLVLTEILFALLWASAFLALTTLFLPAGTLDPTSLPYIRYAAYGLLGLLGMTGIGLVLLGASLRYKQVGALSDVILYYMLFFSGFFLPLEQLPPIVRWLDTTNPLYWTVHGAATGWNALPATITCALAWLLAGTLLARITLRWAKRSGRLTAYI